MKKYDYLIVGAGLFGAVFAHEATKKGKTCLVIDKRDHIGGNIYTEEVEGIQVHKYGAHIFHTSKKEIWDYVNQFTEFNHFVNSPIAVYKDCLLYTSTCTAGHAALGDQVCKIAWKQEICHQRNYKQSDKHQGSLYKVCYTDRHKRCV